MNNFIFISALMCIYLVLNCVATSPNFETNSQQTLNDEQPITDDTIRKLLVKLSQLLGPSPQALPAQSISIDGGQGSFNGTADDLSRLSITSAHVNMTTLEFLVAISYTSLQMKGFYDLYVDNENIHLTGSDAFSVNITDLSTQVYIKLNLTSTNTLQMEQFDLDYDANIQVDFHNLGGSKRVSDRLNYLMNYLMPETITATKPLAVEKARETAFQRSQFLLTGMTVEKLTSIINSIAGS